MSSPQLNSFSLSEAQCIAHYISDYIDLVDNVPDEIARHLTQLHDLHHKCLILMEKLEDCNKMSNSCDNKAKSNYLNIQRIEHYLIQLQEINDGKLRLAQNIFDMAEAKGKELDADYESILLGSAVNTLTNARSSKLWNSQKNGEKCLNGKTSMKEKNDKNGDLIILNKRTLPKRACANKDEGSDQTEEVPKKKVSTIKAVSKENSLPFNVVKSSKHSFYNFARNKKVNKLAIRLKARRTSGLSFSLKKNSKKLQLESKSNSNNHSLKKEDHKELKNTTNNAPNGTIKRNEKTGVRNKVRDKISVKKNNAASKVKKSKVASTDEESNDNNDSEEFIGEPIDPNEPVYCLCGRVSFGEMICCDNDLCSIEWFHFPCVNLSHKPKGKWYCPSCRGERSNLPRK